jgi:hypothetical protein
MLRIVRQGCRGLYVLAVLFAVLVSAPLRAQPMDAPAPAHAAAAAGPTHAADAALVLNQRRIVLFRASLLGDTPSERAMLAQSALDAALEKDGPGKVARIGVGDAVRFDLDGDTLFYLVADDFPGPRASGMLDAAAQRVESRLNIAIAEHREIGDPRRIRSAPPSRCWPACSPLCWSACCSGSAASPRPGWTSRSKAGAAGIPTSMCSAPMPAMSRPPPGSP